MELVRTFRTYYDHFRIAFPHLVSIPKLYDKDWGGEFRAHSREFVKNEDMHAVKHVFDSAGYGTERWEKLISLNPEDLTGRFDQIIALNGFGKLEKGGEPPTPIDPTADRATRARGVLGEDLWNLLLESPESFVDLLDSVASVPAPPEVSVSQPSMPIEIRSSEPAGESEASLVPGTIGPAIVRLIEAVGEEEWGRILSDPDVLVKALRGPSDSEVSDPLSVENEIADVTGVTQAVASDDVILEAPLSEAPVLDAAAEGHLEALKAIGKEKKDLEAELEKTREELSAAVKASEKLLHQLEDHVREQDAMQKKIASVEEKLKEAEAKAQKARIPEKPTVVAPTKASQQLQEYEQSLRQAEECLGELETKTETDYLRIKELNEDLKREQFLRQKYEDDLEETHTALKEQIQRLHAVLKNEEEIPAIDEFEDMSGDELMEYIGDVEKEKQRVMVGLDALDTQEQGYQKQIEPKMISWVRSRRTWVSSRSLPWRWKLKSCRKRSRNRRANCRCFAYGIF